MNRKHTVPHKRPDNVGQIIKRLLSYLNDFKVHMIIVCVLIVLSSLAGVLGNAFVAPIIDDHILPLAKAHALGLELDYSGLVKILITLVGIISNYTYNRIMIVISQSSLKNIRDQIFEKNAKTSYPLF